MILPDLILRSRVNKVLKTTGMDALAKCYDKKHFKAFPHDVTHNYNSRGYRDDEWPDSIEELRDAIWCFGDSFTVGMGSPLSHTWVNVLQENTGRRCINVSMDGATNHWIARKVCRVLDDINPGNIVIQWSFLHRFELADETLSDEQRRPRADLNKDEEAQAAEFVSLVANVVQHQSSTTNIMYSHIPPGGLYDNRRIWNNIKAESWGDAPESLAEYEALSTSIKDEIHDLHHATSDIKAALSLSAAISQLVAGSDLPVVGWDVEQIDLARDGFHYDLKTSEKFVDYIMPLLK